MRCAIIDTVKSRRSSLAAQFTALNCSVFMFDGQSWVPDQPETPELIFFHASDQGLASLVQQTTATAFIVWFSGAGVKDPGKLVPHGIGIPRAIQTAEDAGPAEWKELLEWAADRKRSPTPVPRLLRPSGPSTVVALSILCLGYQMARDPLSPLSDRAEIAKQVTSHEWWKKPFIPLGAQLQQRVSEDWGSTPVPSTVTALVDWIQDGQVLPPELDSIVREARTAIDARLQGKTSSAAPGDARGA